jgi:hypothetical protein
LGFPNWPIIYFINYTPTSSLAPFITAPSIAIKTFSGAVAGEKEDFCKGSFARTFFTLFIILLYFTFTCIILSKTQKN